MNEPNSPTAPTHYVMIYCDSGATRCIEGRHEKIMHWVTWTAHYNRSDAENTAAEMRSNKSPETKIHVVTRGERTRIP